MKNWNTLEADINLIMNKHYTKGRGGQTIRKIVVHHNCGNLTTKGCWDVWQNRQASAHYQVEANGTIGQLVWDADTDWHAGDWQTNLSSIGIEHANNHNGAPWTISEATLDNGAHLVAALCHYYKLGRPTWGVNVFGHNHFSATNCPGEIAGSQHAVYMARAGYWYDHMNSTPTPAPAPDPKPVPAGKSIDDLAREVISGAWDNGEERVTRLTSAGYNYDMIQTRVNQILGAAPTPAKKPAAPAPNIDVLADAVIRGDYGNGDERRRRLGNLYDQVQARVNTKLGY